MAPQKPVLIIIDEAGDLTIRLYTTQGEKEEIILANGKKCTGRILASFKVSREILIENSNQLKVLLAGMFAEACQDIIDVQEGTVESLELWFRVLHGTMTEEMYSIQIKEVWEAIEVSQYRGFPIEKLNDWFDEWLSHKDASKMDLDEMRTLLYPCKEFNHAHGFAKFTKNLAYKMAEHITEDNPTHHHDHHLDGHIIGSINGARGSLRSKLIRGLFEPVGDFLVVKCPCKAESLFEYMKGVSKTGIWPLEGSHKKSIQEILDSPGFKEFDCKVPAGACFSCMGRITHAAVSKIRGKIVDDFNGLCLDCMERSDSYGGHYDEDYWEHDFERKWDIDCRISHSQPSWYFSFTGRKTKMKAHQLEKKKRYKK